MFCFHEETLSWQRKLSSLASQIREAAKRYMLLQNDAESDEINLKVVMDQKTANYIVTYYSSLMSDNEKIAFRHYSSTIKLEGNKNPKMLDMYKVKGWISDNTEILSLLENGYDNFEVNAAKNILQNFPEEVFLNNCPKCNKLARTPFAKQCRFCGFDRHNKSNSI